MHILNRSPHHRRYLPYRWIIVLFFAIAPLIAKNRQNQLHIMLDPAGDAQHKGRQLATCYERSVTLQLCETLKEKILQKVPDCTVTITRTAGEARSQDQRAQMANQLQPDLFVHISCFEDTALRPSLGLYYMLPTSNVLYSPAPYSLIPACKAGNKNAPQSKNIVQALEKCLNNKTSWYTVQKPHAIPDARLASIMVPACTVEFGVSRTVPWTYLTEPLNAALLEILQELT